MDMTTLRLQIHDSDSGRELLTTIINHDLSNDEKNLVCVPHDLEQQIPNWRNKNLKILCTGLAFEISIEMDLRPPASIKILREDDGAIIERFMFRLREKIREYLKEISANFLVTSKK